MGGIRSLNDKVERRFMFKGKCFVNCKMYYKFMLKMLKILEFYL